MECIIETEPKAARGYNRSDPAASTPADVPGMQFTCNSCPYRKLTDEMNNRAQMSAQECTDTKEELYAVAGIKVPCGMAAVAVAELAGEGDI